MKITTKEIEVPRPPRIHTLELTDNELALLRRLAEFYARPRDPLDLATTRFLAQTKTDCLPQITDLASAFSGK